MGETTELRWFEQFPKCPCGSSAQGILRGSRNDSYGYHCKRCAERRLKDSERARKRKLEEMGKPLRAATLERAAQTVREEWQKAVKEFGLRPGSPTEALVGRVLIALIPPTPEREGG